MGIFAGGRPRCGAARMSNVPRDAMSYVDPDTGYTMLPGSQRPDGTWRKPRRVKEGYTPQDEVPLYESKGKAIAKAREGGYIPGLSASPPSNSGYSSISNFKIDTFVIPTPVHVIPGLNTDASPVPLPISSKNKKKKKSSNQSQVTSNGVSELTTQLSSTSITDKPGGGQQPVATDPAKKLRNLKKKLRDIEALEAKLSSGEIDKPEPEQLDKVARKQDVMKEIFALEKQVQSQG